MTDDASSTDAGEYSEEYEVEKIVDMKKFPDGQEKYLVRWKGYPPEDSTWEPIENLDGCLEKLQEFLAKRHQEKKRLKEEKREREQQRMKEKSKHKHSSSSSKEHSKTEKVVEKEKPKQIPQQPRPPNPNENLFVFQNYGQPKFVQPQNIQWNNQKKEIHPLSLLFGIDQAYLEKCPQSILNGQCEPILVKDMKKVGSDYEVTAITNHPLAKEITLPLEVARKICPQLVISYMLKKWSLTIME